jgi:integrase/recombinase XerD
VNEYINRFLQVLRVERNYSEHTLRAYRGDLEAFSHWLGANDKTLQDASHRTMRSYLASLSVAGCSKTTVNRKLSAVRALYKWLDQQELIMGSSVSAIKGPKNPRSLPKLVSTHDLAKLLEPATGNKPVELRDDAIMELLYASGARISELAALTPRCIDFAQGLMRLFGKGSKERIVPLYPLALQKVQRYVTEARPFLQAKATEKPVTRSVAHLAAMHRAATQSVASQQKQADALFLGKSGKPMSADSIRAAFKQRVRRAGADGSISPHDMRHTYATHLLSNDADLRSVQELLGHRNLSTTQIYTHLSLAHLSTVAKQAHPRSCL